MAFRTEHIQTDGSINIDGSIYQWNVNFAGGVGDVTKLYVDGSLAARDVSIKWCEDQFMFSAVNSLNYALIRWAGDTGRHPQNSGVILSDANLMTFPNTKITGLATATDSSDAANKYYIDNLLSNYSLVGHLHNDKLSVVDFDTSMLAYATNASVNLANQKFITNVSLGTDFFWSGGYLEVSAGIGDVTKAYVDALMRRVEDLEGLLSGTNISDIDGNIYNTVTIGDQVWMAENLKTTRFLNGDEIGTTTPANLEIVFAPDPIYQWAYDGNEKNADKYGRLYTWYAVIDPRGICPVGWHLPSDAEWTIMENYLVANKYNYDGTTSGNKIAQSMASTTGWGYSVETGSVGNTIYPDIRNISGFNGQPGGYRNMEGKFVNIGNSACWWSSTEDYTYNAFYRYLYISRGDLNKSSYIEFSGISVRCIKDKK